MCPEYHWTTIAFNKNFGATASARHRDDKDASHQVAMALGDYEGGCLRVHGDLGITDCDTRNRWVRFDGRYAHEVLFYGRLSATTPTYCLPACLPAYPPTHPLTQRAYTLTYFLRCYRTWARAIPSSTSSWCRRSLST